jgi:glycosyltransferase involved in cell wall biosynthesis
MLQSLSVEYGVEFRGVVIPNGADPTRFVPASKRPSVCAVGRFWDEAKNLQLLLAAARELRWPVYLAGDLSAPDGRSVADHGLAHVHSLGRLEGERLTRLFGHSAVFAHPARYEPFGLSVLEAALSGCALVLGDIPSLRELWQGAAHFVGCDDEQALRACLERLLSAPQLRRSWGLRARSRALAYTPARCGAAYERQYAQLLRAARPDDQRGSVRAQNRTVAAYQPGRV